jgi:3',5'-nucleoside bisphosphate phosphatase
MIDLHCHSFYSDGAHSPADLFDMAVEAGLQMMALTDHDTLAGLDDLHKAAGASDKTIRIINGIELSARWKKHEVHILGLNVPLDGSDFNAVVESQAESRQKRALDISKKLEAIGLQDSYNKACKLAGHEHIGRPHFAKVLLEEGYTKDFQQGFNRYLGRGKIAYVPTSWVSLEEAVYAIKASGGQAVVAHPLKYSLTRTKVRELIEAFKDAGGDAVEVVSGAILSDQMQEVVRLCNQFELLASSGSDFHSTIMSTTQLGAQRDLPLNCTPIWTDWTL